MTAEIWDSSEKIGDYSWKVLPEPGDLIEVNADGEVNPYEVEKLINYYALGVEEPTLRIIVKYVGTSWAGIL